MAELPRTPEGQVAVPPTAAEMGRESVCTAACDQPSERHTTSDCPCWQAGYDVGLEAQRERVGGGTA